MEEAGGDAPTTKATQRLDRSEFLAAVQVNEADYTMPGGKTILLRGLDVDGGMGAIMGSARDPEEVATKLKQMVLDGVIEPKLEEEDLLALAKGNLGLINAIGNAILELSGVDVAGGDQTEAFLLSTQQSKPSTSSVSTPSDASPGS